MTRPANAPSAYRFSRRALPRLAALAGLLVAASASAQAPETLFMRIEGVKGENLSGQPLGPDAFRLKNFSVSTDPIEPGTQVTKQATSGERFQDVNFTMPISGPAIALFQLAAQRAEVPKASLVAIDPATGATRYRVDLEQVVVRSLGLQTTGTRDAAVGELGYQRIRLRYGEDDKAPSAGWDRAKNAPLK